MKLWERLVAHQELEKKQTQTRRGRGLTFSEFMDELYLSLLRQGINTIISITKWISGII